MTKRLYRGGGGSEHDEAALWDAFLVPGQRIVLLPLALPAERHAGARTWLSGALASRGDFRLVAGSACLDRAPAGTALRPLAPLP